MQLGSSRELKGQRRENPRVDEENQGEEAANVVLTKLLKMVQVQPHICGLWLCTVHWGAEQMQRQCCLNPPAAPCLQLLHELPASARTELDTRHVNPEEMGEDLAGHQRAAAGEPHVSSLTAVPRCVQGTKAPCSRLSHVCATNNEH